VEVMAMGESSHANFPEIDGDLLGTYTFICDGGWSFRVFNSFGLTGSLG
jgi:hypothetical protein